MQIILYKFSKKINSTAQPTSSTESLTLECLVKTPSSIISPAVQLSKGVEPIGYNYAYIADWGRYYFINDIEYSMGYWTLYLSVDVLASFKTGILSSEQYVLRSASSSDGNILDELYTTKALSSYASNSAGTVTDETAHTLNAYWSTDYKDGYFVIGVISNNSTGVSYFQMDYDDFATFMQQLMAYVPADMSDVSAGLAKSIFDPLQYLVSCKWYPVSMINGLSQGYNFLYIGGYRIENITVYRLANSRQKIFDTTIEIPKHPQSSNYPYTNLAPFSEYVLVFEPFGSIAIDTTKIYNTDILRLRWYVDNGTGDAILHIYTTLLEYHIVDVLRSNIGVDVPVSQIVVDYLGAGASLVGGITGAVANAAAFDVGGAINSAISGIAGAVNSAKPNLTTKGMPGSFISYLTGAPRLYGYFYEQVDTDPDLFGRPLCQVKTLSALSGYALCSNASISLPCTESERGTIESYLNSGVYLE